MKRSRNLSGRGQPAIRMVPLEMPKRAADTSKPKPVIDIPLDDEPPAQLPAAKEPGRFTGFFRHKSTQQKTPDEVLAEAADRTPEETPAAGETAVAAKKPAIPAVHPLSTEPEPAAPVAETPSKKAVANEVAAQTAAVAEEIAQKMAAGGESYQFPPITLLRRNQGENYTETGAELRNNSRRLAETLTSFGVDATPGDVVHGPSVTRYEFVLDQGVEAQQDYQPRQMTLPWRLGASGVRIAPIPDKISVVGIEVPNKQVTPVLIRDVIESKDVSQSTSPRWPLLWARTSAAAMSCGRHCKAAPRAHCRYHRFW